MPYIPDMAFLTSSVGTGEWIILFAVVLVVIGPRRLPEVARKFGRTMEMFRRAADEFKEQLMSMDQEINKTVADSTKGVDIDGVEGNQGPDDVYQPSYNYDEGAYDHSADYPGNEDAVKEWNSNQESTALANAVPDAASPECPESGPATECAPATDALAAADAAAPAAAEPAPEPVKEKS